MKSKAVIVPCVLLLAFTIFASVTVKSEDAGTLFPAPFWNPDGSFAGYGYINRSGQKVIAGQFKSARPFSEGLARVKGGNDRYGYIDKTGKLAIPFSYSVAGDFSEGFAVATSGDKSSYIDKSGNFLFAPRSVNPKPFSEGMGCVAKYEGKPAWYVDRTGKTAVNKSDTFCSPFREGLALMALGTGSVAAIDKSGNVVFTIKSEVGVYRPFSEGLALVQAKTDRGMMYGFVDKSGQFVIAPRYPDAKSFSEGLAAVSTGFAQGGASNWGYIDKTGAMVITPRFCSAESFHDGMAGVGVANPAVDSFIDKTGKVVITLTETALGMEDEDYMDYKTGDLRQGFFFREGLAKIKLSNEKIAYINKTGKIVWESEKALDF